MRNSEKRSGLSFCDVLQIVFIALKLAHVIDWSWGYVFIPLYIEVFFVLIVGGFIAYWKEHK